LLFCKLSWHVLLPMKEWHNGLRHVLTKSNANCEAVPQTGSRLITTNHAPQQPQQLYLSYSDLEKGELLSWFNILIGVDFEPGQSAVMCPPYLRNAYAFISYHHLWPSQYYGFPQYFYKSAPVEILLSLHGYTYLNPVSFITFITKSYIGLFKWTTQERSQPKRSRITQIWVVEGMI